MVWTVRMLMYHYDEFDTTHCSIYDITVSANSPAEADMKARDAFNEEIKIFSSPGGSEYVGRMEGEIYATPPVTYCHDGQTHRYIRI